MNKIYIKLKDQYLQQNLASELSMCLPEIQVEAGIGQGFVLSDEPSECGIQLEEDYSWLPVSSLALRVKEAMGIATDCSERISSSDVVFIGISSGCGGCGLSSSAIALGRIYSRLYGFQTLYLSFERFCFGNASGNSFDHDIEKLIYGILEKHDMSAEKLQNCLYQDDFGLYYFRWDSVCNPFVMEDFEKLYEVLKALAQTGKFLRIILDIPADFVHLKKLMSVCEKRIIVSSFDKKSASFADRAAAFTDPDCIRLKHGKDDYSFENGDVDIHGQFGAEVREIAELLELY